MQNCKCNYEIDGYCVWRQKVFLHFPRINIYHGKLKVFSWFSEPILTADFYLISFCPAFWIFIFAYVFWGFFSCPLFISMQETKNNYNVISCTTLCLPQKLTWKSTEWQSGNILSKMNFNFILTWIKFLSATVQICYSQ